MIMGYKAENGIEFNVRLVSKGQTYGADFCLTHEGDEPLVEFYDMRYPHTKFGQFVSRYNFDTIVNDNENDYVGLNLDGGIPDWTIDKFTMANIRTDLRAMKNV